MAEHRTTRTRYVKPTVTRVDFVEDEIALAVCKTNQPVVPTQGANPGSCQAKQCNRNGTS